MTDEKPESAGDEPAAPAAPARAEVPIVVPTGDALDRADRLAAIALAFVIVGALGGGLLELIYALTE